MCFRGTSVSCVCAAGAGCPAGGVEQSGVPGLVADVRAGPLPGWRGSASRGARGQCLSICHMRRQDGAGLPFGRLPTDPTWTSGFYCCDEILKTELLSP